MQNKLVENWLINVNELTFTIPFCQLLLAKGLKIVHISSQGPMEQGKDVIATDKNGNVFCYQLKGGDIKSKDWAAMKAEVDQLVELPPKHTSLSKEVTKWEAYLVTNGKIANPTARDIYDYSESKCKAGHQPLQTIVQGELLADFAKYFGDFLPVEIDDLQIFLDLYNQNGDYMLDNKAFKTFFEKFFISKNKVSNPKQVEAVRASLILCNYLLTYKLAKQNYIEIIKAHLLLLASLYDYTERHKIPNNKWKDSEGLIYELIESQYRLLIDELENHPQHYIQDEYGLLSEALTYKIRCTELIGFLSAYLNYCHISGKKAYKPEVVGGLLTDLSSATTKVLLGEYFMPFLVNYIVHLHFEKNDQEVAKELVSAFVSLLSCHTGKNLGMPSPYYDITQSVEWTLGINKEKITEGFQHRSYSIRTIISLLALLGGRPVLKAHWREISYICQQEIVPDKCVDYLRWKIEEGKQIDHFPDATQSWEKLAKQAEADYSQFLPESIKAKPYFIPFMINVMPHRINHKFVLTMIKKT